MDGNLAGDTNTELHRLNQPLLRDTLAAIESRLGPGCYVARPLAVKTAARCTAVCDRQSLGEEDDRRQKPLGRTLQRIDRCPGKVATPGTECCVATGRPALRSVHRECNCLVIEPRKAMVVGASVVPLSGRSTFTPYGLSVKVPPGSKSGAGCTREVRQEPVRSLVSYVSPVGQPVKSPGSTVPRSVPSRTNQRARRR